PAIHPASARVPQARPSACRRPANRKRSRTASPRESPSRAGTCQPASVPARRPPRRRLRPVRASTSALPLAPSSPGVLRAQVGELLGHADLQAAWHGMIIRTRRHLVGKIFDTGGKGVRLVVRVTVFAAMSDLLHEL